MEENETVSSARIARIGGWSLHILFVKATINYNSLTSLTNTQATPECSGDRRAASTWQLAGRSSNDSTLLRQSTLGGFALVATKSAPNARKSEYQMRRGRALAHRHSRPSRSNSVVKLQTACPTAIARRFAHSPPQLHSPSRSYVSYFFLPRCYLRTCVYN